MKLAEWARKNNIHPRTAERWFHKGILPVEAKQLPSGTILINNTEIKYTTGNSVIYARVSTYDQKTDLKNQLIRLREFCASNGIIVKTEVSDIASGLNENRKNLINILKDATIDTIIVEHKDRLTRFGFNLINEILLSQNRRIIVMNETDLKDDIVQDFVDVITSMCSRIYGKRSAKNKREKLIKTIKEE